MKNYIGNWGLMRIIRLILGVIITIQGVSAMEWRLIALGSLLILMPVLNIGCCGTAGCARPVLPKRGKKTNGEINFEEVR